MEKHVLFDPLTQPFQGVASYPTPRALRPGFWPKAFNIRSDDLSLRVRKGYRVLYQHGSSVTCRGAVSAFGKIYLALDNGTNTELYEVDPINLVATKPNPSVPLAKNKDVGMTAVKRYRTLAASVKTLLVTAKGEDLAVLVPGDAVYPIAEPDKMYRFVRWPQIDPKQIHVLADTPNYFRINNVVVTFVTTGGSLTGTHLVAGDPITITATGAVDGHAIEIDFGLGPDGYSNGVGLGLHFHSASWPNVPDSDSLIMLVEDPSSVWVNLFKIEVSGPDGSWVIWDPSPTGKNSIADLFYGEAADGTGRAWVFDLTEIKGIHRQIRKIKFTYKGHNGFSSTLKIHAIVGGGTIAGESAWALSYHGFQEEGQAAVQFNSTTTRLLKDTGGSRPWGNYHIPHSAAAKYKYDISLPNPPDMANLIWAQVYRVDAGANHAYFQKGIVVRNPTSGYVYGGGAGDRITISVNDSMSKDESIRAHIGTGLATGDYLSDVSGYAGNRFVACNNEQSALYVAESMQPLRFTGVVEFIEDVPAPWSGTFVLLGEDVVQSIVKMASSIIGADTLYILTDRSVYSMEMADVESASRPRLVLRHGTPSKFGATTFSDVLAFVDSERQVRFLSADGTSTPSRMMVEDWLLNCPKVGEICAAYYKDAFYFSLSAPGETENRHMLVWDLRLGKWYVYRYPVGVDIVRMFPHTLPDGTPMLLAALRNGTLIELETGTADNGASINIELESPAIHASPWEIVSAGRIGLLLDPVSATLQTSRSVQAGTEDVASGQIVLAGGSEAIWQWDKASGHGAVPGAAGASVQFQISGALPGDTRIYAIFCEMDSSGVTGAAGG